jgi:hypothetical protein
MYITKDLKMKKIILFITLAMSSNVMSSNYVVTLDNKHYNDSIEIKIDYDKDGYNGEGLHKDTGTAFNPQGVNKEGERDCNSPNTFFSIDHHNRHTQDYTRFTTRNGTFTVNGRMKQNIKNPNDLNDPYYYYGHYFTFQGLVGSDNQYRASTCRKLAL